MESLFAGPQEAAATPPTGVLLSLPEAVVVGIDFVEFPSVSVIVYGGVSLENAPKPLPNSSDDRVTG